MNYAHGILVALFLFHHAIEACLVEGRPKRLKWYNTEIGNIPPIIKKKSKIKRKNKRAHHKHHKDLRKKDIENKQEEQKEKVGSSQKRRKHESVEEETEESKDTEGGDDEADEEGEKIEIEIDMELLVYMPYPCRLPSCKAVFADTKLRNGHEVSCKDKYPEEIQLLCRKFTFACFIYDKEWEFNESRNNIFDTLKPEMRKRKIILSLPRDSFLVQTLNKRRIDNQKNSIDNIPHDEAEPMDCEQEDTSLLRDDEDHWEETVIAKGWPN